MRRSLERGGDLALAVGVVLLADLLHVAAPQTGARALVGLAALLVAPGYALVAALFPAARRTLRVEAGRDEDARAREEHEGLTPLQRVGLSLGLGLAMAPLLGLGLHFTPWGLNAGPLLACLTLLTAGLCALAHVRRRRLGERAFTLARGPRAPAAALDHALTLAVVLGVLAAGGALAYVLASPPPQHPFTELYLLGPDGAADGYPATLAPGERASVRVVVANHEGRAQSYAMRLVVAPVREGDEGPARTLDAWSLTLADGEKMDEARAFEAPREPGQHRVAFELRREGDAEAYRVVHLLVRVVDPAAPPPTTPPG